MRRQAAQRRGPGWLPRRALRASRPFRRRIGTILGCRCAIGFDLGLDRFERFRFGLGGAAVQFDQQFCRRRGDRVGVGFGRTIFGVRNRRFDGDVGGDHVARGSRRDHHGRSRDVTTAVGVTTAPGVTSAALAAATSTVGMAASNCSKPPSSPPPVGVWPIVLRKAAKPAGVDDLRIGEGGRAHHDAPPSIRRRRIPPRARCGRLASRRRSASASADLRLRS